jgi:hypothetical protein
MRFSEPGNQHDFMKQVPDVRFAAVLFGKKSMIDHNIEFL